MTKPIQKCQGQDLSLFRCDFRKGGRKPGNIGISRETVQISRPLLTPAGQIDLKAITLPAAHDLNGALTNQRQKPSHRRAMRWVKTRRPAPHQQHGAMDGLGRRLIILRDTLRHSQQQRCRDVEQTAESRIISRGDKPDQSLQIGWRGSQRCTDQRRFRGLDHNPSRAVKGGILLMVKTERLTRFILPSLFDFRHRFTPRAGRSQQSPPAMRSVAVPHLH